MSYNTSLVMIYLLQYETATAKLSLHLIAIEIPTLHHRYLLPCEVQHKLTNLSTHAEKGSPDLWRHNRWLTGVLLQSYWYLFDDDIPIVISILLVGCLT